MATGKVYKVSFEKGKIQSYRNKMKGKRSQDMIISQILEVCVDGASKTRIVYKSNLNFRTATPYIDLLVKCGLIESVQDDRIVYRTTDKGIEIMKGFKYHHEMISKLKIAIEEYP